MNQKSLKSRVLPLETLRDKSAGLVTVLLSIVTDWFKTGIVCFSNVTAESSLEYLSKYQAPFRYVEPTMLAISPETM